MSNLSLKLTTDGAVGVRETFVQGGKRLTVVKMTGDRTDVTAWVYLTQAEAKQLAAALVDGREDTANEQ